MIGHREPSGEEIARRAHELYLQRGGEHGKDVEDWVRAEKELSDEPVEGPAKRGSPKPFVTRLIDVPPMSKHLVSRVPRARQRIPRLDGQVFPISQDRRDLSFGGRGPVRPLPCPAKGKLGGETRLPMVKMKQWVPIDGTRWRNEFVNDHESRGACIHCGVA